MRCSPRFFVLAALGALLVASPLAATVSAAPSAPSPCTIEITISPRNRDAEVNATRAVAVTFLGNYTANLPPLAERATVQFTAVVDTGWVATVSPASITITNQRAGTITVTVVAPAGARPSDVGSLTVTARMQAAGLQCQDEESGLTITPLPYFDAIVGSMSPSEVKINNGVGSFTLKLGSVASVPVSVGIEYIGPAGLVFLGPSTVSLPDPALATPNATAIVKIQAPDLPSGIYQLTIHLTGSTGQGVTHDGTLMAPLNVVEQPIDVFATPWVPLAAIGAVGAAAFVWWRRR